MDAAAAADVAALGEAHKAASDGHEKRYVCTVPGCDYKTGDKSNFDKHKKRHGTSDGHEKRYVCSVPGCGYKTGDKSDFNKHQKWHEDSDENDERVKQALEATNAGYLFGTSMYEIKRRVKQGDASAECFLGWAYYHRGEPWVHRDVYKGDHGVEQSDDEAIKLFGSAARKCYGPAQYNLGLAYAAGRGVNQSDDESAKWFRAAAAQGAKRDDSVAENGLLFEGDHHEVIRKNSESNADCAQIIGALATSANVRGCEKLFALMYGAN
jgi:TPR repeat protein